jgi:tRNA (guanine37-N1)-methyltransferase
MPPAPKASSPLRIDILTIFPEIFDSYFSESLFRRAQEKGIVKIAVHNIRDFTSDRHQKVDDRPFGGGPGMVLKVEPIFKAIQSLIKKSGGKKERTRMILFSTRGKKLDAAVAKRLARYDRLVLICGRYEGVDERVADHIADEEISIGDYVLSGGEIPAMALAEAVSRFRPEFLGKYESLEEIKGSYPVYTRPEEFSSGKGKKPWRIPKVLLSGNHKEIDAWRRRR